MAMKSPNSAGDRRNRGTGRTGDTGRTRAPGGPHLPGPNGDHGAAGGMPRHHRPDGGLGGGMVAPSDWPAYPKPPEDLRPKITRTPADGGCNMLAGGASAGHPDDTADCGVNVDAGGFVAGGMMGL